MLAVAPGAGTTVTCPLGKGTSVIANVAMLPTIKRLCNPSKLIGYCWAMLRRRA